MCLTVARHLPSDQPAVRRRRLVWSFIWLKRQHHDFNVVGAVRNPVIAAVKPRLRHVVSRRDIGLGQLWRELAESHPKTRHRRRRQQRALPLRPQHRQYRVDEVALVERAAGQRDAQKLSASALSLRFDMARIDASLAAAAAAASPSSSRFLPYTKCSKRRSGAPSGSVW